MPTGWKRRWFAAPVTVLMESWNADAALALIDRHSVVGTVAATPFLVELAACRARRRQWLPRSASLPAAARRFRLI
jgi:hypothetical protein